MSRPGSSDQPRSTSHQNHYDKSAVLCNIAFWLLSTPVSIIIQWQNFIVTSGIYITHCLRFWAPVVPVGCDSDFSQLSPEAHRDARARGWCWLLRGQSPTIRRAPQRPECCLYISAPSRGCFGFRVFLAKCIYIAMLKSTPLSRYKHANICPQK